MGESPLFDPSVWVEFSEELDRGHIIVLDRLGVRSMILQDDLLAKGQIVFDPMSFEYKWGFLEYPLGNENGLQEGIMDALKKVMEMEFEKEEDPE